MHTLHQALFLTAALTATYAAAARDVYVDGNIGASCGDYDATNRACGTGAEQAYPTLAGAAGVAAAGDVVVVRQGTYEERLVSERSGTAGSPITFRGAEGEDAVIRDLSDPAILIRDHSYVVVESFIVQDSLGWGRLEDADHITIRDVTFERARANGTTGGFKLVRTTQSRIVDNRFIDGNDNVVMQESDYNVIEDNVFDTGRHSLLSVRCSNYNIFRNNRFQNPDQKAMEIYDCEGVSDAPIRYDATHRNLIESNRFELTRGTDRDHRYNAIQYAGQLGVVRKNLFYDNAGGGLNFQIYSDEALINYGHRAYHNTFVDNRCHAIISDNSTSSDYGDNRVVNNLLYRNVGCGGEDEQINSRNPTSTVFADNAVVDAAPGFVDLDGRDLRLDEGSSMIDAATFLTEAVADGSGTELIVQDAKYFLDGNGIEGEAGDLIQLDGDVNTARVVALDMDSGTLTLDTTLTWTSGQGVALAYAGESPDFGALEHGFVEPPPGDDDDDDIPPGPDDSDSDPPGDGGGTSPGADPDPTNPTDGGATSADGGSCGCVAVGVAHRQDTTLWWAAACAFALVVARRRRQARQRKPLAT